MGRGGGMVMKGGRDGRRESECNYFPPPLSHQAILYAM